MAQAKFAAGEFDSTVRDSVRTKTSVRTRIITENVAGVMQPTFLLLGINEGKEDQMIGITKGGQAIKRAQEAYCKYLELLVKIATLQTQFVTIERTLKVTNRRVNALEFVIIPRIETAIKWIDSELEEFDREDLFRLKVVKNKKELMKEAEDKELYDRKAAAAKKAGVDLDAAGDEEEDTNVL